MLEKKMNFLSLIFVLCIPIAAVQIIKKPYCGLLLMLAVNPLEALIKTPSGLTAGRIVGSITIVGWGMFLSRNELALKRLRMSPLTKCIWAFPFICFLGAVFCSKAAIFATSLSLAVNVSLLALMAMMIDNLTIGRREISLILMIVILSSVVAGIFPAAYHFNLDLYTPLGINPEDTIHVGMRAKGLTNNANALGIAMSMGLFALIIRMHVFLQKKVIIAIYLGFALVMLGGLVLSGSRTHFLAFLSYIVLFWVIRIFGPAKGRMHSFVSLVILSVLLPFSFQEAPEKLQTRLLVFEGEGQGYSADRMDFAKVQRKQALTILQDSPFLGVGLFGYRSRWENQADAHDTVSALLGETGLLGTVAMLWLLISCLRMISPGVKNWRQHNDLDLYHCSIGVLTSLIAMLIAGFGGAIIFYQRWFWISIGLSPVMLRWICSSIQQMNSKRKCIK